MKIKYVGPQGIVEVENIGIFKKGEPVEIDDKIAESLIKHEVFEVAKNKSKEVK